MKKKDVIFGCLAFLVCLLTAFLFGPLVHDWDWPWRFLFFMAAGVVEAFFIGEIIYPVIYKD